MSHVPCAQGMPGRVDVCVQVLLRRLAGADAVARVVVGKDVAVDASAKADVEAAHLAQVHGVTVGEKHRESDGTQRKRDGVRTESRTSKDSKPVSKLFGNVINTTADTNIYNRHTLPKSLVQTLT